MQLPPHSITLLVLCVPHMVSPASFPLCLTLRPVYLSLACPLSVSLSWPMDTWLCSLPHNILLFSSCSGASGSPSVLRPPQLPHVDHGYVFMSSIQKLYVSRAVQSNTATMSHM